MSAPDQSPESSVSTGGGAYVRGSINTGGGDFIGRDKNIYTRSALEELNDYLAAAVPRYASAQMQRVLHAQSQQIITEPYKFLDSFDLEDANFFFGRSTAVQALYQTVNANRLTVLHAKSGAGKTSLLNAGLAPKLITTGRLPIYARAFHDPVQAVKRAIAPVSAGPWPDMLHKLSLSDFLGLVCSHLPKPMQELVLILDQFEEFFIFWPLGEQRQPFVDDLARCYQDVALPMRLILSLRKDYYSDLATLRPYIPAIFSSEFLLEPMERAQAAAAITGPVSRLGNPVTYFPDLLNALLDDLGSSGMELPHMQIVCKGLFDKAQFSGTNTIDLPSYEHLGRAPGILGNYLKGMLASFPGRTGTIAKVILIELVSSEGTKRTLSYATLARRVESPRSELNDTLNRLVSARLLRPDDVEGEIVYEIAHEYLIEEIKQWIDKSDLAPKQAEELLSREVINWRIHHTLIPRDRLELIHAQRDHLGYIDDTTGDCLLHSALQSDFAVQDWLDFVARSTITPLLTLLDDSSPDGNSIYDRRAVPEALGKLGSVAVGPLITALNHTNAGVRWGAAEALGHLGDARAVDPLIAALSDADVNVHLGAASALSKLGNVAVEPLITALNHTNADVRWGAAEALGHLGDARAVDPLIDALSDEDANVRLVATVALGQLGEVRAVNPLITSLKDAHVQVHWGATMALAKLGDMTVEPLLAALRDRNAHLRSGAAVVLGHVGDARAFDPLVAALEDRNVEVRKAALGALARLGGDRAVELLIAALENGDAKVRRAAAAGLANMGDAAVAPFIASLKSGGVDMGVGATVLLVNKVLKMIARVLSARASSVYLVDKWRERLKILAATGYHQHVLLMNPEASYEWGEGITGIIAQQEIIVRANTLEELHRTPGWCGKYIRVQRHEPNSFLGVPLKISDSLAEKARVIGVLKVEDIQASQNHPNEHFTDQDLLFVTMMAKVIVGVIRRTRNGKKSPPERPFFD